MKSHVEQFNEEISYNISGLRTDVELQASSREWINRIAIHKYTYNFRWLGRPIIQLPQDMVAMQEIIWEVKPDLIIETGIAHGGSLVLSASMLTLLDYCAAVESGEMLDPQQPHGHVIGIDIDIRPHNLTAIKAHPLSNRIEMIQGSSIAPDVIAEVQRRASQYQRILVCLDSMHTHDHVLAELQAYAPLVSLGSYCVVFDTIIEDMPPDAFPNRPWGPGNNPKTAVWEFLKTHDEFTIDKDIEHKLLITVAPDGFLKRV